MMLDVVVDDTALLLTLRYGSIRYKCMFCDGASAEKWNFVSVYGLQKILECKVPY